MDLKVTFPEPLAKSSTVLFNNVSIVWDTVALKPEPKVLVIRLLNTPSFKRFEFSFIISNNLLLLYLLVPSVHSVISWLEHNSFTKGLVLDEYGT